MCVVCVIGGCLSSRGTQALSAEPSVIQIPFYQLSLYNKTIGLTTLFLSYLDITHISLEISQKMVPFILLFMRIMHPCIASAIVHRHRDPLMPCTVYELSGCVMRVLRTHKS